MSGKRKTPSPYPKRVYAKHGALYYVDLNRRWHRLADGLKWTRDAEIALARARLEEAPGGNKMADLLNAYLKHCENVLLPAGDLSQRTVEDKRAEIVNLIGYFGRMAPALVKPEHVGGYKRGRGATSRAQCNHELSTLSSAFAFGMEEGLAPANPVKGIRRWKVRPRRDLPSEQLVGDFLKWLRTQGEVGELCAAAYDIAYLTTQRRGDVLRIRTASADETGITFLQRKGRESVQVTVEWTPRLREAWQDALRWRTAHRGTLRRRLVKPSARPALVSPWLFCNRIGHPYTDRGFKAIFGKLAKRWVDEGNERVRWHDGTRARGTSKMKADGRQAHEVTGHLTEATAERVYDRRKKFKGRAVE